jgi:hypothetical protein
LDVNQPPKGRIVSECRLNGSAMIWASTFLSHEPFGHYRFLTTERSAVPAPTQLRKSKIIVENIHTIVVLRPTALLGLCLGEGD